MTNEEKALAMMTRYVDATHRVLEGVELMCDARALAAVYIARASKIMATLRVRGITDRNEIEQLAEYLVVEALRDENAGTAKNPEGRELLTPAEKAKSH